MPSRLKEEEYDRRLATLGKVKRVGPYINSSTSTLHLCLKHGEVLPSRPSDLLQGHGLACCSNLGANKKAKSEYDQKIAKLGNVERVGEYVTRRTPIEHRCLVHNKVFLMEPRRALEGRKLPCCGGYYRGSLYSMLSEPSRWGSKAKSYLYIYKMKNYEGYVKIGISVNPEVRSLDEEYGELICYWEMSSRFKAFLVEQAILSDVLLKNNCPPKLIDINWPGKTEVRESSGELSIKVAEFYLDKIEELGVHTFILDYLNPTSEERAICMQKKNKFNKKWGESLTISLPTVTSELLNNRP